MNKLTTLKTAIKNKSNIKLTYKGTSQKPSIRIFSPYVVFEKEGKLFVSGTQVANLSENGGNDEPRVFQLAKMKNIAIIKSTFFYDDRFQREKYKNAVAIVDE